MCVIHPDMKWARTLSRRQRASLQRSWGSRGPGNRRGLLSTNPQAESEQDGGKTEHRGGQGPRPSLAHSLLTEEEPELNDDFCDQIAKHWIYQVLSLPPSGARPPEQPRKELLGPGRRGDEHREGAQNERHTKMSPVPTRVADCTMVTTGVNQSWICFKKESLKH